MSEVEEGKVVIEEVAEAKEEESFDIEGLTNEEVDLAKEHGLYKEEEKPKEEEDALHKKQSKAKTQEDSKSEEGGEKSEEVSEEDITFEMVENDKDGKLYKKLSRPNRALYHRFKAHKERMFEAEKEAKELKEKLATINTDELSSKKIKKIQDALQDTTSPITIELLESIINEKSEPKNEEEKKAEEIKFVQMKVGRKAQHAEDIGKAQYENFENIYKLASEVISADKSGTYQRLIDESFMDDNVDENMLVERVVNIARLSPKFDDVVNQVDPEKKEKEDRVLKNSKKKVSSASIGSSGGRRIISENELTCEQASRLSLDQWTALKESTKERILMGIDP
jgi:hypothetical protein